MKDKICKYPGCGMRAQKKLSITIQGNTTGTIRVLRFCTEPHLEKFKNGIVAHNEKLRNARGD